jgi:hypothetical protein
MNYSHAFKRVVSQFFDDYYAPRVEEVSGVTIYLERDSFGKVVDDGWLDIAEEWLPKMREIDWLPHLSNIQVIENCTGAGTYYPTGSITLQPGVPNLSDSISENLIHGATESVGGTKEHVLVHEMIHHAHLTLNGHETRSISSDVAHKLERDVSEYASTNQREAVAEIGTGIVFGADYPDWVHEYYESLDGPQGVYELRDESV